ncbi:MAG: thiamine biosynthesis protein [Waddliaceae bacterium]|nr:thiamine biosynthesis protein [Waddliaceae bacterium]
MRKLLFIPLIIALFLLSTWFTQESAETSTVLKIRGVAMTVPYEVQVPFQINQEEKKEVMATIEGVFQEVDQKYNRWNPKSEIGFLNDHMQIEAPISLSPSLLQFLKETDYLVRLSQNRFDPTVEPLKQLWKNYAALGVTPPKEELEAAKQSVGWENITLDHDLGISTKNSDTRIDLDGIAKGYAVDLILERLSQNGLESIYVEWGGEIRCYGQHPEGRPWRIFISRMGDPDPEHAIATIDLDQRALATSGDYNQIWNLKTPEGDEIEVCHIIDPISKEPLKIREDGISSVSVLTRKCFVADALATAAMMFERGEEASAWVQEVQKEIPDLETWIFTRNGKLFHNPRVNHDL